MPDKPKTIPFGGSAPAPVSAPTTKPKTIPFAAAAPTTTTEIPKQGGNALVDFAKGIFSAPTTLLARPVQAVAALAGASNEQIDEATKKIPILGGLIAPTPKNYGDVVKDVGRGAETVALGLGPVAGGLLYGAGNSVEQGNDLLSTQTAFNAVLGAAGGKVLGLVGKPLLSTSGKVIGTITPKILKDVAATGAKGIQEFAATHNLLGGVAAPAAQAIERGAAKVENAVNSGASKVVGGIKNVAKSQFPDLSPTQHYQAVNAKDIARPTTVNEPKYAKSTRIFNEAQDKGINLADVANKRGIIHDQLAEGGRYNTTDVVDSLRQNNYEVSDKIARPAIKAAEPGVALVPVKDVRAAMLKRVSDIPDSQVDPADRAKMIQMINRKYAPGGAVEQKYPNGYSLTNLHDSRIISGKNGGYKPGASSSDALKAQLSREEGRVFSSVFDNAAPDELGIKPFRKELEQNFQLADYLESLHNKSVPAGVTKKAARLFGKALTATVGGKIGGFPGSILGAQYGDMLFSTFEAMPNPIKMRVLQSVKLEDPKIFKELVRYIANTNFENLTRPQLPAAGASSFRPASPTLFTTPGGNTTPIKGEAFDLGNVESGKVKPPKSGRSSATQRKLIEMAQENGGPYIAPKDLPTIKMGPKKKGKKSLNDIL